MVKPHTHTHTHTHPHPHTKVFDEPLRVEERGGTGKELALITDESDTPRAYAMQQGKR